MVDSSSSSGINGSASSGEGLRQRLPTANLPQKEENDQDVDAKDKDSGENEMGKTPDGTSASPRSRSLPFDHPRLTFDTFDQSLKYLELTICSRPYLIQDYPNHLSTSLLFLYYRYNSSYSVSYLQQPRDISFWHTLRVGD
jgi:hypothetical protein